MIDQTVAEVILHQLGGRGFRGAPAYCGARRIAFDENQLSMFVNGRRDYKTIMTVVLTPGDYYSVTLEWRNPEGVTLGKTHLPMVFADELKQQFEQLYDEHIKEHCGGFIDLD